MFRPHVLFPLLFLAATPALLLAQTQPPVPLIRAQSNLVVVDVTVTDAHGNPIRGLTGADFTVLEDGHAQAVKNFEVHEATSATTQPAPLLKLPAGTFSNRAAAPDNGALNILVLDKLNTPLTSQGYVLQQFKEYLKTMKPGTRIAIFGLTTRLQMLQGFTSDPAVLRAFLDGKKGLPGASVMMNDSVSGDNAGQQTVSDQISDMVGDDPDMATMIANLQQFEAEQQSFQLQLRAHYTLDAFNLLARYLEIMPGRKNVLWFSGSFPISILPDGDLQNPFAVVADSEQEFRETTTLLARSQVAVYPIDARGLMVAPMMDVTNTGSKYAKNPGAYAKDNAKFFQQTASEHGTMQQMAEATGGKAYVDSNGLKEAAAQALDIGSNYYTLSYAPVNAKWKGEYRKIQVKVSKPEVTLGYRRGYYAEDPYAEPEHHAPADGQPAQPGKDAPLPKDAPPPFDALRTAMIHGAPAPSQLVFEVTARPVAGGPEAGVANGNTPNPKIKGPFQRYLVHFSLSPRQLNCAADAAGVHQCLLQVSLYVYDADGQLINIQGSSIHAALDEARFQRMLDVRFAYNQQISVPTKGNYYIRSGLRDLNSQRIGALEFPVATVARLAPVEVPAAAGH